MSLKPRINLATPYRTVALVLGLILGFNGELSAWAQEALNTPDDSPPSPTEFVSLPHSKTDTSDLGDKPLILALNPERLMDLLEHDNLDLDLARLRIIESRWEVTQSSSRLLPSFQLSWGLEKFTGGDVVIGAAPFKIDRVTQRQRAGLSYDIQGFAPIFNLKGRVSALKQAHRTYDHTRQEQLMEAFREYHQWLRDQGGIHVAVQALEEARKQVKQESDRYESGLGTQLDVEQAQVIEAEREADWLTAQNNAAVTAQKLASRLNLPLRVQLQVEDPENQAFQTVQHWDTLPALSALYQTALENRPDLKAMDEAIKVAKAAEWESANALLPRVSLNSYFGNVGPQTGDFSRQFSRGVQLSLDTLRYLGVEAVSNFQLQRQKVKQAVLQKEQELNQIKSKLAEAYYGTLYAKKQLDVVEKKVKSAQEAYRIAKARKATGLGIQIEVIQAQTKLSEAQQGFLQAVLNQNQAQIQLMFETGQLTPDKLLIALDAGNPMMPPVMQAEGSEDLEDENSLGILPEENSGQKESASLEIDALEQNTPSPTEPETFGALSIETLEPLKAMEQKKEPLETESSSWHLMVEGL